MPNRRSSINTSRSTSTSGIVERFRRAEIPLRASALAYHSILGVVPIFGLLAVYIHSLGFTKDATEAFQSFLLSHINVGSNQLFVRQFERLTVAAGSLASSPPGLLLLLYTAYSLLTKLGGGLDSILRTGRAEAIDETPKLGWLLVRRIFVVTGLPLALLLSTVAASWLQRDSLLREIFQMRTVGPLLAFPIPPAIDTLALFAIYRLVPKHPASWKECLRAAVVTGPVFTAVKMAFGLYNRKIFFSVKLYGALSTIPIFLIWVYLAWMIVLCGALFMRPRSARAIS